LASWKDIDTTIRLLVHAIWYARFSTSLRSVAMEVSEMLKKAWTAVEDAGIPDKLHEVAFREAMRVLVPVPGTPVASASAGKLGGVSGGSTAIGASGAAGHDGDLGVTQKEIFDRVVTHTGVDREKLEGLVHLDGDVLRVSIPGIKLGKTNAEKIRAVAQILTIVRGFGLEEDGTAVELVPAETVRLKCYDKANFSAHLGKLNGYVITGSGSNRRIRAKAAGIQAFPAFVDTLLGGS
jgi:hypothetical protein